MIIDLPWYLSKHILRILYVRKVSSGFEYFLLIFVLRLGMTLKVVGIDAELNSLSNGDIFNWGHRAKNRVLIPNTEFEGEGEGVMVRSNLTDTLVLKVSIWGENAIF